MKPNWAVYHRYADRQPVEFLELRWFDRALLRVAGRVNTWGSEEWLSMSGEDQCRAEFESLGRSAETAGLRLAFIANHSPSQFDYGRFVSELRVAARAAFSAIRASQTASPPNAYALLTDSSAMTIGPVAGLVDIASGGDSVWNCSEWQFFEGVGFFDICYRMILTQHRGPESNVPFGEFQPRMFESCIQALEGLVQEGFFGSPDERAGVVVRFQVSDHDEIPGATQRLNTPEIARAFDSWG